MKLSFICIFILLAGGLLFQGCSTKKDALINRNWHALNTKYNVLYNGNIAFEEGREQLNNSYKDDYWQVLPVERLEVREEIELDSENNNPNFIIAEEKATKAIQKHSMDIDDEERNPQTDESFLLLGKSRYFDQRFVPALEAFNYILNKYVTSDKLNEATLWREKTNIRLENEELALKNLKRLMQYEALRDQQYADARATMAQAYINLSHPDSAVQQLKIASAYTRKNPEKGRYYFIIGQLYNQQEFKDSANIAFDKVIELNRKSPRVYFINSHLQKIQNTELTEANKVEMLEYLTHLEEDRENRPYLDKIYRQIALYHMDNEADSLGLVYYDKSLRATSDLPQLNALNYEDVAEYNFEEHQYKTAGAYYDSVLSNLAQNTKKYRDTKRKLDNLEDVIRYEEVVQNADSIITLYNMPEEARKAYFETHIARLKEAADKATREQERMANTGFATFAASKGGQENQGKFYFYNITSLGYGKTEFVNNWGKRSLEDDWRWSDKNKALSKDISIAAADTLKVNLAEDQRYELAYYMDQIPTDKGVIDSLSTERNFANYQLGLIYKEKFKENQLAASRLEDVLKSQPEERLILPSKYNLYKIYEATESPLTQQMKEDIIRNHPDSRYAELLLNPQTVLSDASDSPEAKYAELFRRFQNQEYLTVITVAEEQINTFTGDPIVPKFEMLKANAIGRLQGFLDYREALNYVALNYPNSPEGKKAQQMIAEQLPNLEPREFSTETGISGGGNWKVVFPFKRQQDEVAMKLMARLQASIVDLRYLNKVSRDIYNLEEEFIVVHGFRSRDFALGYVELLKNNKDYKIDNENFVILTSNYKIIQVHKNLQEYMDKSLTPKP